MTQKTADDFMQMTHRDRPDANVGAMITDRFAAYLDQPPVPTGPDERALGTVLRAPQHTEAYYQRRWEHQAVTGPVPLPPDLEATIMKGTRRSRTSRS